MTPTSFQSQSPSELLESFFKTYPAEKAQAILWSWFVLSIKGQFSKLPPKELQEFGDFFESLDLLIQTVNLLRKQNPATE